MQVFEKELRKIGLSDKEARVYLASVELGASPVQALANKAGVNRATTYVMIESLIGRGLMSSFSKGKKKLFHAESPDVVLRLLDEEKRQLDEKESSFKKILADLKALANASGTHPKVLFFEGESGVEQMRNSILESKERLIEEFSPIDQAHKYFPPHDSDHRQQFRDKHEIKLIYTSKKGAILSPSEKKIERRYVSAEKFPFEGDIAIYGSKVNIIYYAPKLLGVVIDHAGISQTFHQLFQLAWIGAKK